MIFDISLQQGVMATRMQNASTTTCYRTTTRHDRRKIYIVFKRMWQIEDVFHEWAARKLLPGNSTLFEYDVQFEDNKGFCVAVFSEDSTLSVSFTPFIWLGMIPVPFIARSRCFSYRIARSCRSMIWRIDLFHFVIQVSPGNRDKR